MNAKKVFIVDDDEDFAESLAMVLEGRGYQVELASSGEEAIRKFRENDYAITFMDVKMSGKNGVESFLEIRKFKPDARVVMMTGYSVEQLLNQAIENGAWDVLSKPLDIAKVLKLISELPAGGVLIADDDPDFVESIKGLLEAVGKIVFVASNGQEAVNRVVAGGIDLLILDMRMPVLNGLEAFLELKRRGCLVPIIVVTAFGTEEMQNVQNMAVNGILKKPFDPGELLNAVEALLK